MTDNNLLLAKLFKEASELLAAQGASSFRVDAWKRAAATLEHLDRDVRELANSEGRAGLVALRGIGEGIASAILEVLNTGRWTLLERLRGSQHPEEVFQSIPTIGPALARRIHDELHIDSLEGLEAAAHDGRLEQVPGIGARRAELIRTLLEARLHRAAPQRSSADGPDVGTLLAIDDEYRRKADAGQLQRIAPKRFNPEAKAWLPILHTHHGAWHFTAMFSNTPTAHRLGRTHDWVVVYFYDEDHHEGQHTVVTEYRGRLKGERVVRGRETECDTYYQTHAGHLRKRAS